MRERAGLQALEPASPVYGRAPCPQKRPASNAIDRAFL